MARFVFIIIYCLFPVLVQGQNLFSNSSGVFVPHLGSAPGTPTAGQMYYNTSTNKLMVYIGSSWVELGASAGDFLANGTVPMSGNLRLNGNWLSNDGGSEGLRVDNSGNVGIGTTSTGARLEVLGQIVSKEHIVASGGSADFSNGSSVVLQSVGGSTITLSNMIAGGIYNVIVEDTTSRTYSFSGCTTTYFSPAIGPTSQRSVFTIYRRGATACYITWTTGFN